MWLKKRLQRYVVPRDFRAVLPRPKSKHISPIFIADEVVPTSSDLGHSIKAALEKSDRLIVLCSEATAGSTWVNEEILYFIASKPDGCIISVIVASNVHDDVRTDLPPFPLSLRTRTPLAADLRPGAESRNRTLTRIAAGLLGAELEVFEHRRKKEAIRRRVGIAVGILTSLLASMIVVSVALLFAVFSRLFLGYAANEDSYVNGLACMQVQPLGASAYSLQLAATNESQTAAAIDIRSRATVLLDACESWNGRIDGKIGPDREDPVWALRANPTSPAP
ncbi:toll/interleukin-1 receptor domain-containing protein [Bradyrhizobium septentrionale]|nr:toll/interleukin-1 receptor domain-containing protein [Bradyrhizobium septentrionale]